MSEITSNPRANLQYVCDMLGQLRLVSAVQGGSVLAYLIDMARHEAADQLQRQPAGPDNPGTDSRQKRDPAV